MTEVVALPETANNNNKKTTTMATTKLSTPGVTSSLTSSSNDASSGSEVLSPPMSKIRRRTTKLREKDVPRVILVTARRYRAGRPDRNFNKDGNSKNDDDDAMGNFIPRALSQCSDDGKHLRRNGPPIVEEFSLVSTYASDDDTCTYTEDGDTPRMMMALSALVNKYLNVDPSQKPACTVVFCAVPEEDEDDNDDDDDSMSTDGTTEQSSLPPDDVAKIDGTDKNDDDNDDDLKEKYDLQRSSTWFLSTRERPDTVPDESERRSVMLSATSVTTATTTTSSSSFPLPDGANQSHGGTLDKQRIIEESLRKAHNNEFVRSLSGSAATTAASTADESSRSSSSSAASSSSSSNSHTRSHDDDEDDDGQQHGSSSNPLCSGTLHAIVTVEDLSDRSHEQGKTYFIRRNQSGLVQAVETFDDSAYETMTHHTEDHTEDHGDDNDDDDDATSFDETDRVSKGKNDDDDDDGSDHYDDDHDDDHSGTDYSTDSGTTPTKKVMKDKKQQRQVTKNRPRSKNNVLEENGHRRSSSSSSSSFATTTTRKKGGSTSTTTTTSSSKRPTKKSISFDVASSSFESIHVEQGKEAEVQGCFIEDDGTVSPSITTVPRGGRSQHFKLRQRLSALLAVPERQRKKKKNNNNNITVEKKDNTNNEDGNVSIKDKDGSDNDEKKKKTREKRKLKGLLVMFGKTFNRKKFLKKNKKNSMNDQEKIDRTRDDDDDEEEESITPQTEDLRPTSSEADETNLLAAMRSANSLQQVLEDLDDDDDDDDDGDGDDEEEEDHEEGQPNDGYEYYRYEDKNHLSWNVNVDSIFDTAAAEIMDIPFVRTYSQEGYEWEEDIQLVSDNNDNDGDGDDDDGDDDDDDGDRGSSQEGASAVAPSTGTEQEERIIRAATSFECVMDDEEC